MFDAILSPSRDPMSISITEHQSHNKIEPSKTNTDRKTNNMYHMHTFGSTECMHVVHSVGFAINVGFGWFYFIAAHRPLSSRPLCSPSPVCS